MTNRIALADHLESRTRELERLNCVRGLNNRASAVKAAGPPLLARLVPPSKTRTTSGPVDYRRL